MYITSRIFFYIRYYFQLLETEVLIAQGFFGIISHFGWRKIKIIAQDESVFTAVRKINTCIFTKLRNDYTLSQHQPKQGRVAKMNDVVIL